MTFLPFLVSKYYKHYKNYVTNVTNITKCHVAYWTQLLRPSRSLLKHIKMKKTLRRPYQQCGFNFWLNFPVYKRSTFTCIGKEINFNLRKLQFFVNRNKDYRKSLPSPTTITRIAIWISFETLLGMKHQQKWYVRSACIDNFNQQQICIHETLKLRSSAKMKP